MKITKYNLKVKDRELTEDNSKYYSYVRYENELICFNTHKIFEDLVDEILTNKKFSLLYSRDSDKNIRKLSRYAQKIDFEIALADEPVIIEEDLYSWESLHVATFPDKDL